MTHGFEIAIHGHLGRHVLRQNNMAIDEALGKQKKKKKAYFYDTAPSPQIHETVNTRPWANTFMFQ